MKYLLHSLGRDLRGSAAVEFALSAIVLSFMMTGLIALGIGLYSQSRVDAAAQAGIRHAQANGFDQESIARAVQNGSNMAGITANPAPQTFCGCMPSGRLQVVACTANCNQGRPAGRYVRVSAQATYQPFITGPGFASSYTLSSVAVARIQ